ncbi:MAG: ABC transporter permease [Victivallales bacterium]|nr:ABC transporter permease [Victivallales bacterium]MCF7888586.1 ABC transporter permease [Victivallales bacterium]
MLKYILKRVFFSLITLWLIATITFVLIHCLPGDPFASEKAIPPAIKAQILKKYDLDKPIHIQYLNYLSQLIRGDLGISMKERGRSVNSIIAVHFPYSLDIGIKAVIFGTVFGIIMGVISALNRGNSWDTTALLIAIFGVSVPSFVIAGILQFLVILISNLTGYHILPVAGFSNFNSTILPSIALGMFSVAMITRMMRASMIEVLGQDYIKTAKAKGCSPSTIIIKHGLRNAIMPIVSYMGPMIAAILTGSFVIEKIFAIPGLGKYFVDSIFNNDYTVILGVVVFYAAFLTVMVLLMDISYGFIDPRVRVHGRRKR